MLNVVFDTATEGILKLYFSRYSSFNYQTKPKCVNDNSICLLEGYMDLGPINCEYDDSQRRALILDITESNKRWEKYIQNYNVCLSCANKSGTLRIWYSDEPFSLCGFYSLISELLDAKLDIYAIKIPKWSVSGEFCELRGWGDIFPEALGEYFRYEEKILDEQRRIISCHWKKLKEDKLMLRTQVNGQLVSAPDSFYDDFIRHSIERGQELTVSNVILRVMKYYNLGISDYFIYKRIISMICSGEVSVVRECERKYDTVILRK